MTDQEIQTLIDKRLTQRFREAQVVFDTALGHNHDGANSRFVTDLSRAFSGGIGVQGNRGNGNKNFGKVINALNITVASEGATDLNYQWTFDRKFTSNVTYVVFVNCWDNNGGSATAVHIQNFATEGDVGGTYCFLCARDAYGGNTAIVFQAIAIGY